LAVQAGVLRFSSGREGLQAADIERIDGSVSFHGGGGCGAQRGLIVNVRLGDAVAEIDDALFLREFAEHLHQGLDGKEFAVGGEGVQISVVFGKGATGFWSAFGAAGGSCVKSLAFG